ncbi:MAG: hypothetical protein AAB263_08125 [Planctomycetota bacterium]
MSLHANALITYAVFITLVCAACSSKSEVAPTPPVEPAPVVAAPTPVKAVATPDTPKTAPVAVVEAPHGRVVRLTQHGITWTFAEPVGSGTFANGDHWVIGPVRIVGITTDLHAPGFTPKPGEDGSMVNPGTNDKQGYDSRVGSYQANLNAALVEGQPIAAERPLNLQPNSSLVSMVSWLYRSATDAEPGIPGFNGGTKAPRPVTRAGAVLTVLSAAPPAGSFRPPYVGDDKAVKFNVAQLDRSKLKNLTPVADTPAVATLEKQMERPWIDHVHQYLGAMVHPSENMPNYGQHMGHVMIQAALMLHLDFTKLPGQPSKDKLLIEFVQYGIDLAGIADHGGNWPANGGHLLGRKWPILFAGAMLNDSHMQDVGNWKTRFQEDDQTFYVSQAEVDVTNGPKWHPDKRAKLVPYTAADIGLPEWGIWHASDPGADNRSWDATYRPINASVYPGFVLAARLMGLEDAWKHKALFDYTDRWMKDTNGVHGSARLPAFAKSMWDAYAASTKIRDGIQRR